MSVGDIVGIVVQVESPFVVHARLSYLESRLNLGSLVVIDDRSGLRLLARVSNISRRNVIQDDRLLQKIDFDSVKLLEEYGIDIEYLTTTTTARLSVIGEIELDRHSVRPPRRPPRLYSLIRMPTREMLEKILSPGQRDTVIHIGSLRDNTDVKLYLNADKLVTHHCAVLAATGSGKSWLAGIVIEELVLRTEVAVIVFDPHSEYSAMQVPASAMGIKLSEEEESLARRISERVTIYVPARADASAIDSYFRRRFGRDRVYERFGIHPTMLPLSVLSKLLEHYYGLSETQRRVLEEVWGAIYGLADEYVTLRDLISEIERVGRQALPRGYAGEASLSSLVSKLRLLFENRPFFIFRAGEYFQGRLVKMLDVEALVRSPGVKIFDLSGLDYVDQQALVAVILDKLLRLAMRRRCRPTLVVVEEAHNFAPSRGDSLSLPVLMRIAREGRKFGIGLLLISQRPTRLHPDILSQCMTHIFKRIINPVDLKYVRDVAEQVQTEDLQELKTLSEDEALIIGLAVKVPVLVKVRKRYTAHGGVTPSLTFFLADEASVPAGSAL